MAVSALVSGGALAGCSVSGDDEPGEPRVTQTRKPTPTPSDQPSPDPTTSTSSSPSVEPSPSSSVSRAPTLEGALLSAAEMPQLNEISKWSERRTGSVTSRPFGLCQRFDLLTIGAERAVERTLASGSATAGQQVAEFPDAQNTVRAGSVVGAWHRDCAGRVKGTTVSVRPISDVAVPRGKGWWYLVSYERAGKGHFHSLGVLLSGNRMTLIRMDHDGQDHNYDPGMDPMELAVKAAAAKLG